MTREIKFRAWDLEKQCWIQDSGTTFTSKEPSEGQVALSLDGHLRVFHTSCYEPDIENGETEGLHAVANSEYESTHPCLTKPSYKKQYELMQFTGLKDKNGKEIYEGDIVKVVGSIDTEYQIGKVEYDYSKGSYVVSWDIWQYNFAVIDEFEVIGNIYENPELLTKGETK